MDKVQIVEFVEQESDSNGGRLIFDVFHMGGKPDEPIITRYRVTESGSKIIHEQYNSGVIKCYD